jgi:hypothetical protein
MFIYLTEGGGELIEVNLEFQPNSALLFIYLHEKFKSIKISFIF